MKRFFVLLGILFVGCSVYASTSCPTPEDYTKYLRSYADKAKNLAMKGGNQAQLAALKKSYENSKPKMAHACLNYFTNVQTPDCRRLKVLYSSYNSVKEESEKQHIETQINSIMGMLGEKCPVDTQVMQLMMGRSKDKKQLD